MGMGDRDHHRSYYAVLGLNLDASADEIRSTYRRLALKWHPDRRQRQPWLLDEANRMFQDIQEAYQVLSDKKKRSMYDANFYQWGFDDREYEEVEGFSDFMEEMMELIATEKKEGKVYSLDELQEMLTEMARGFESPPPSMASAWFVESEEPSRGVKRSRDDTNPTVGTKPRVV